MLKICFGKKWPNNKMGSYQGHPVIRGPGEYYVKHVSVTKYQIKKLSVTYQIFKLHRSYII